MQRATCNTYIEKRKKQTNVRRPQEGYLKKEVRRESKCKAQGAMHKPQIANRKSASASARASCKKGGVCSKERGVPHANCTIYSMRRQHEAQDTERRARSSARCKARAQNVPCLPSEQGIERPCTIKGDLKLTSVRAERMTQNRDLNCAHTSSKCKP